MRCVPGGTAYIQKKRLAEKGGGALPGRRTILVKRASALAGSGEDRRARSASAVSHSTRNSVPLLRLCRSDQAERPGRVSVAVPAGT
ncbi:hypothetical protein NDU88_000252 [Pleurodeles waltl]|uniref:Uncharacterized protein n=1 Tax=Pleurodeles waltl TaxID=8319 RepID=A0AAV7VSY1_PLEWA|nr:hypothetical protein NDU88_000252 [Pleurodeles waltl]